MPRLRHRDFRGGLYLSHPRDEVPPHTLYRARGIRNPALTRSLRSRFGSVLVAAFPLTRMHSIVTWHDQRYYGGTNNAANAFGSGGFALALPLPDKLTFVSGIPTAGKGTLAESGTSPEHLFIAGGGRARKLRDGNIETSWGLDPPSPPVPVVAEPIAFTSGINFKFWENFNALGTGINPIHPIAGDQNSEDVTLAIETDPERLPPGGPSVACLRVTINDGHFAVLQRALPNALGEASQQDFRSFGNPSDGPVSAEQDWIVLDVMCDHPELIESFQINFGTMDDPFSAEYPAVCTHIRECVVDDPIVRQHQTQPYGVGDIAQVRDDQAALVDQDKGPSSQFIRQAADVMANDRLSSVAYEWRRLKIPKSSFTIGARPGEDPWEHISLWQIVIRTREDKRLDTNTNVQQLHLWIDSGSMFGGTGMQGEYKYHFTFKSHVTGSRSNPMEEPVVVKAPFRTGVQLAGLPLPNDPQADRLEIWRTQGNGSIFFLADEIPSGRPVYFDYVADYRGLAQYPLEVIRPIDALEKLKVLGKEEIEFDNIVPPDTMADVVGPQGGRLFGTRDSAAGSEGRVYFSAIGKFESWPDFLEVSGDNDPMQKLVIYSGVVYAFSQDKCWEIVGTGPFEARELFGVPGTRFPFSVVATPYGIIYLASGGVRVLNGASSTYVAPEAVSTLFRGEDAEGLSAFPSTTNPQHISAEFWRDEYLISDGSVTLAVNLATGCWREVGVALQSMHRETDTDKLLVGRTGEILDWEVPGVFTDNGVAIPFNVQTPAFRPDEGLSEFIFQRLYVDINTNGDVVPVTVFAHEHQSAIQGGPFAIRTFQRETVEIPMCAPVGVGYLSFNANLVAEVEIFGIGDDVHIPVDPNAT